MKKVILCSLLAAMLAMTACGNTAEIDENATDGTLSAEVTTTQTAETDAPETTVTEPETTASEVTTVSEAEETKPTETKPTETEATGVTEAKPTVTADSSVADAFMNIMSSKKGYYEMEFVESSSAVKAAYDYTGSVPKVYSDMSLFGFRMVSMKNENGTYSFNMDEKTYNYYSGNETDRKFEFNVDTFKSYKKISSGTAAFQGAQCPYIEYEIVEDDKPYATKVFYKDGKVIGINSGEDVKILAYSAEPSAELFKVPAGFKEQELLEVTVIPGEGVTIID